LSSNKSSRTRLSTASWHLSQRAFGYCCTLLRVHWHVNAQLPGTSANDQRSSWTSGTCQSTVTKPSTFRTLTARLRSPTARDVLRVPSGALISPDPNPLRTRWIPARKAGYSREEETTRGFILCGDTNVIGYMTDGFKVLVSCNAPKCQ
jgi:hypothetical protein